MLGFACALLLITSSTEERDLARLLGQPHDLIDVEIEFAHTWRYQPPASASDGSAPIDQALVKTLLFTRDGYVLRSRSLDPLISPLDATPDGPQIVMTTGQDQWVIHDGSVEVWYEDIPGVDNDEMVVRAQPILLRDEDPRCFGRLPRDLPPGTVEGSPTGFVIHYSGEERVEVDVDPETQACAAIRFRSCSGAIVGEWAYSGFEAFPIEGTERRIVLPSIASLRRYDAVGTLVQRSTYVVKSLRHAPGRSATAQLASLEFPAATDVRDDRFQPRAHYKAGGPDGLAVRFAAVGRTLVNSAVTRDVASRPFEATPLPTGRTRVTAAATWAGAGVLVVALAGFASRRRPRSGSKAITNALCVAGFLGIGANASTAFAREVDALDLGAVSSHAVIEREVTFRGEAASCGELELIASTPAITCWPKRLTVRDGEDVRIRVCVVVPIAQRPATESIRFVRGGDRDSTIATIPVRWDATVAATPSASVEAPHGTPTSVALSASSLVESIVGVVELGEIGDRTMVPFECWLKNKSSAPIEVGDYWTDCGCVGIEISASTIEPGATCIVRGKFDPKGRVGPIARGIHLALVGERSEIVDIPLRATIVPSIVCTPQRIDGGILRPGDGGFVELVVTRSVAGAGVTAVESFELEVDTFVEERIGPSSTSLKIGFRAPDRAGRLSGTLAVMFEGRSDPVTIPFAYEIRDVVYAEPSDVVLGTVESDVPDRYVREIVVRGDEPITIESLEFASTLLDVVVGESRPDGAQALRVGLRAGLDPGFVRASIEVRVAGRATPLRIPVYAVVVR